MTEKLSPREYLQALNSRGYGIVPPSVFKISDVLALYAKIDELNATIANLNEGAKIMHAFATGGESKLLEDWQDEKTDFNTPKPRIIVSQSWLDKHTNNGIDDLKPTFGQIDFIGGTRNK